MTLLRALTISVAAIFLAGCSQTSGSQCAGWKMLRPSAEDVRAMSSRFVADVLEHNENGVDKGCWRAPR